jgi:hypothetical protein
MVWRLAFLMGHVKRGLLALFLTWPGFATAADNAPAPPVTTPSPATAAGTTDQGNTKDQKNKPDQANSQDQGNKQAQANGEGSFPDPDCTGDIPKVPPRGNQVLRVALSDLPSSSRGTIWQPRGDEVNFTITSVKGGTLDPMKVAVCFRWRGSTRASDWMPSPMPLRTIKIDSTGSITYAARVPNLPDAATNWFSRVFGQAGQDEYAGLWIVPIAEFRTVATTNVDWKNLDTILPLGVTSISFATIVAILGLVIAWLVLYRYGRSRNVPGNDPVLKLVSSRGGFASLSQLQVLMWSFVVGASAIYVMALSGELIPISTGTLVLLGIAGVATVGSKLQSHVSDQAAGGATTGTATPTPAAPTAPGRVDGLHVAPGFVQTDREVQLKWSKPRDGGPVDRYVVQYRTAAAGSNLAGQWITASDTVTAAGLTVVGLEPATAYEFQVAAANTGDTGPFSPTLGGVTTTADSTAAAQPIVSNVTVEGPDTDGTVLNVKWSGVSGAHTYIVQYRLHDSDELWRNSQPQKKNAMTIEGLIPNSNYDLRVAAQMPAGQSKWSSLLSSRTGPRRPLWSDLVVTPGTANTVDIARVQMLFFTVVTALFVAMKVLTSNQIPEIPEGFLLLMGISNGVYLTSKLIPD